MKVDYKKDLRHNYMIITKDESMESETYCILMLEQQKVEGLLSFKQQEVDNQTLYYYDITGMQSMTILMEKAALSYNKVKNILSGILHALENAYEYLLPEDDIIITPEYIYLDVISYEPSLCFLSGLHRNCKEQISMLLEYLMNKVDYNDKAAVLLVYQLYAVSREEGFTLEHLNEVVHKPFQEEITRKTLPDDRDGISLVEQNPRVEGSRGERISEERSKENRINRDRSIKERTEDERYNSINLRSEEEISYGRSKGNNYGIPEEIEGEEEVMVYPALSYVLTAVGIAGGVFLLYLGRHFGIFFNSFGNRIEYDKLLALLLMIACVEGFLMNKLWSKKNRLVKIVSKKEFVNPREEHSSTSDSSYIKKISVDKKLQQDEVKTMTTSEKEIHNLNNSVGGKEDKLDKEDNPIMNEDYNPTCLLNEIVPPITKKTCIILQSPEESSYPSIMITDIPFFIGKLKTNVDYCLENDVISRYHAKITKEGETYHLTDLNSKNGTFVNREPLRTYEPKEITFGDEIAFANITYKLVRTP